MIYINPFLFMGLENKPEYKTKETNQCLEKYRFSENIIQFISELYDIDIEEMKSKSRKQFLTYPRYICFALIKSNTDLTLKSIGYLFSKRDHATVLHGIKQFQALSDQRFGDKTFIALVKTLEEYVQIKNIELFQATKTKEKPTQIAMPEPSDFLDHNQINLIDSINEVEQVSK